MKGTLLKRLCKNIVMLTVAGLAGLAMFSRCANQGMPTGGPKDSIPPMLLETSPLMKGVNFSGDEVRLTFNEYIISDAISEELVISPPLTKRPTIRTKSRTLIIGFNEELKPDVTYSLDFKNSVADNNERNPYLGLRMLFGTGSTIDTLRVAGMVKDAAFLEPRDKYTVMLYSNLEDTAVTRSKPDYIARTDSRGLYLFDNVKPGKYNLFALNDANTNLQYDLGAEEFAFADSLVIPSSEFIEDPDTLAIGADSLLLAGHILFKPDPVYLRTFTEDFYEQFLDKSSRDSRQTCTFVFGEPVDDTLGIRLLNHEAKDWYLLEPNAENDSIIMWVTDTLVTRYDTLRLELAYYQLDSLKNRFLERDTVQLISTDKERVELRRRKKEETIQEAIQFTFNDNHKNIGFDLNQPFRLISPKPVKSFDFSKIHLTKTDDPAQTPLKFNVSIDSTAYRTYLIEHKWEAGVQYALEIDSAACENIYGETSTKVAKQFMTQETDFYGRIILNLTSVEKPLIVSLLDNAKEEKTLDTLHIFRNGKVTFDYLSPAKYKVKIIFDENHNGKWDTGSYANRKQPERVAYLPEIVKVRSNWDNQYEWDLKPDPTFRKVLIDKEEEELKLKKLEEERRREQEQEREGPMLDQGGGFNLPR